MTNTIAIVGGGVSGTLTVLNCIKQSKNPLTIIWFDTKGNFCKGLAYSTSEEKHLLNVRANNMSVFVDEPNHFVNWLNQYHPHFSPSDFVSRKIFGEYVKNTFDVLKDTNPLVKIIQIAEEVTSIDKTGNEFEIKTLHAYKAQKLVLAFGNFLPAHPRSASKEFIGSENYFQNAFHPNLIHQTLSKKNITIIGSGLTMLDVIVSLHHHQYKGSIHIVSPHAYIPHAHQESTLPSVKPFLEANKKYSLSELLSLVNQQFKATVKEGLNPYSVIDVMRPHLQFIWINFSLAEKQQFLRHLRHKWGVARHRAPSQSMAILNQMQSSGILHLAKGRVMDIKPNGNGFDIYYLGQQNCIQTELIINCTGPESNYGQITSPLVQYMVKNHFFGPDSINYGINAAKNGEISPNLYTIGPPLKGVLWESTAVPEIRLQAKELAAKIICN